MTKMLFTQIKVPVPFSEKVYVRDVLLWFESQHLRAVYPTGIIGWQVKLKYSLCVKLTLIFLNNCGSLEGFIFIQIVSDAGNSTNSMNRDLLEKFIFKKFTDSF
jgi:hypothetical protein